MWLQTSSDTVDLFDPSSDMLVKVRHLGRCSPCRPAPVSAIGLLLRLRDCAPAIFFEFGGGALCRGLVCRSISPRSVGFSCGWCPHNWFRLDRLVVGRLCWLLALVI